MARPSSQDPEPIVIPAKPKARIKAMIELRRGDPTALFDSKTKKPKFPKSDIIECLRILRKKFDGRFKRTAQEEQLWRQFVKPKQDESKPPKK